MVRPFGVLLCIVVAALVPLQAHTEDWAGLGRLRVRPAIGVAGHLWHRAPVPFSRLLLVVPAGAQAQATLAAAPPLAPPYLGQPAPGRTPALFAPGLVSTGQDEHGSPVFTPDLQEAYWTVNVASGGASVTHTILAVRRDGTRWSRPELFEPTRRFAFSENPCLSPDGRRLYFNASVTFDSQRNAPTELYVADRTASGWREPNRVRFEGPAFPLGPSLSARGNLFFYNADRGDPSRSGLAFATPVGDGFNAPILLDARVRAGRSTYTPLVAPDERWIVFASWREEGLGRCDLYISFREADGRWGDPVLLPTGINSDANERFPTLSPDGRFLFFLSSRSRSGADPCGPGNGSGDVYWVDARILDDAGRAREAFGQSDPLHRGSSRTPAARPPAVGQQIQSAARAGDLAAVKDLLARAPGLLSAADAHGSTALHAAAEAGHIEVVALLLDRGAGVDGRNGLRRTPLLVSRRLDVLGLLLDKGADIDAKDMYGFSLLELAAARGDAPLADLLLRRGAALPAGADPKRMVFARLAARNGMVGFFERVVAGAPDVRVRDEAGDSLLHAAAAGGSPPIVGRLLEAGLPAADANRIGWTPLHVAAEAGRLAAVEMLVAHGAATDARTTDGRSAFDLARELGRGDVADLLASRGASAGGPVFPVLTGPFMGQMLPGRAPEPFALGIVGGRHSLHGVVSFSPDGQTARWSALAYRGSPAAILESVSIDGRWTPPRVSAYSAQGGWDDEPFPSPDGQKLFFVSNRPLDRGQAAGKNNIWVVERVGTAWSEPRPLPAAINAMQIARQVSVDREGTLYFGAIAESQGYGMHDLYRSRFKDGAYSVPENLGPAVNTATSQHSPFIAPDGSYLVFTSEVTGGDSALFITYRRADGTWTQGREVTSAIGHRGFAACPWVTPDGAILFFLARIADAFVPFWVRADFIEALRPRDSMRYDVGYRE